MALIIICSLPAIYLAQDPPNAVPMIRLDKTRFVVGEHVFFWLGVKQSNSSPIPPKFQKTCRITITRPDGTQKTEKVSWPIDGPLDSGWTGGWGVGDEPVQIGKYTLVFEFAGQRTSPVYLFVDDIRILQKIKVDFLFGNTNNKTSSPLDVTLPTDQKVIFLVRNDSDQTVRFPALGQAGRFEQDSYVSVSMKLEGKYESDFFYPEGKLAKEKSLIGSTMYPHFTWDAIGKVSTITLKPGETYRRELMLQSVLDEAGKNLPFGPGNYKITFSTAIEILVGGRNGPWAALSPFRVEARSTASYVVSR
ncbi:MAG: hypothetical protein JO314_12545 [Acidobacteria bacterium]|nr:hypothetical protein [Acidobacteriota bacterium]